MPWSSVIFSQPVSPQKKSRCHQERRYSPSVASLSPISSCFFDDVLDLAVLDRLDLGRADLAALALGARVLDRGAAQDRADMIGAEWRRRALHARSYSLYPAQLGATLVPLE